MKTKQDIKIITKRMRVAAGVQNKSELARVLGVKPQSLQTADSQGHAQIF